MTKVNTNIQIIQAFLERFKISLFSNTFAKVNKVITLWDFQQMVTQSLPVQKKIGTLREITDKEKFDKYKITRLEAVTISGTFNNKHLRECLIEHSNLLQIDIDNPNNLKSLHEKLKHDKYVLMLFYSPSNKGLKAIVQIDGSKHDSSFIAFEKYFLDTYEIAIDKQCKDVCRLMYVSHDKECFVNIEAETLKLDGANENFEHVAPGSTKQPGQKTKKENLTKIQGRINHPKNVVECWQFTEQKATYQDGNRNEFLMMFASNCNRAGLIENESLQFALDNCNDLLESEIKATIASAYKNTSEHGKYKFKPLTERIINNPISSEVKKEIDTKVDLKEINKLTEKEKLIAGLYKRINDSEGKLKDVVIQYNGMIEIMYYLGYRRFDIENEYIVVKIESNVISQETPHIVQENVFRFIDSLPNVLPKEVDKGILIEKLRKSRDKLFNKGFFTMLIPDKEYIFNTDTSNEVFIYYRNGFVKVTANGVEFLEYKNLTGYIWKNQILNRDFKQIDENKGDYIFLKYLKNIANNDILRLLSLQTLIGYLLHNFFDTKLKAVVFTDSSITDEPNGRTGKTLLGKALEKIKPTTIINGKTFIPDSQFRYQEVSYETQIIFLNDLKPHFPVETLFNDITEKVKIERKNQSPVSQYAKFLIATNRTLKIVNASAKDRFVEFEFSEHYSEKFSPLLEFKKMFFGHEFTKNDWYEFDNVICDCIREYLVSGIIEAPVINLHKRKAIDETNSDFVSWFDSLLENGFIVHMMELDKAELHNKFLNDYPDYRVNKYLSQQKTFSKFVLTYCRYSEIVKCTERKSNDKRYFTFTLDQNVI